MCKLCNTSDVVRRFYDIDDSSCKSCRNHMAQKVTFTWVLLLLSLLFVLFTYRYGQARTVRKVKIRYARSLAKWKPVKSCLRIVWGTYQILTKIPSTYQLSLPKAVADVIARIVPVIDLGLGNFAAVPLECLGFRGYLPQLLFVMMVPPFAVALAHPLVVSRERKTPIGQRTSRASVAVDHARQELPVILFISFLAFPVVSSQACGLQHSNSPFQARPRVSGPHVLHTLS